MKVNNLTMFFPETPGAENYSKARQRSTILTQGDIIKLYAETNSENPSHWHMNATQNDKWWKMSFDARKNLSN